MGDVGPDPKVTASNGQPLVEPDELSETVSDLHTKLTEGARWMAARSGTRVARTGQSGRKARVDDRPGWP